MIINEGCTIKKKWNCQSSFGAPLANNLWNTILETRFRLFEAIMIFIGFMHIIQGGAP